MFFKVPDKSGHPFEQVARNTRSGSIRLEKFAMAGCGILKFFVAASVPGRITTIELSAFQARLRDRRLEAGEILRRESGLNSQKLRRKVLIIGPAGD